MKQGSIRVAVPLAAVLLATVLAAAPPSPAQAQDKRLPVTEATTRQKADFVTNLVTDSAAANLIRSKGDAEAKKALADATALVRQAQAELDAGKVEAANEAVNAAVRMVTETARRLSMGELGADHAQKLFASRRDSVTAMIDAYDRIVEEKGRAAASDRRAKVTAYLREADGLHAKGELEPANQMLDKAYQLATAMTRDLRDGDTLVRELSFKGPEDEYHYEVDRNDSHFFLLDLTLKEKSPHPSFLTKIDDLKAEAQALRKEAEALAAQGQHAAATDKLDQSTKRLIKAIRMGGNFIPG